MPAGRCESADRWLHDGKDGWPRELAIEPVGETRPCDVGQTAALSTRVQHSQNQRQPQRGARRTGDRGAGEGGVEQANLSLSRKGA